MKKSIRFRETMTGFVTVGATSHQRGFDTGKRNGMECTFTVTIAIADVERHLAEPAEWALAYGEVYCPAFGGRRRISYGEFKLFEVASDGTRRMRYRLPFDDDQGRSLELAGTKTVAGDAGLWSETTTLETTIRLAEATVSDAPGGDGVVARGVVRIRPAAFARQLTTWRGGPQATGAFLGGFARNLAAVYRPPASAELATAA